MNKYEQSEFRYQLAEICRGEYNRWYMKNIILSGFTDEQLMARKVLWSHFKNDRYDEKFNMIDELNVFVWRTHFRRGLDVSEKEIHNRSKRLGLWLFGY